MNEELHRLKEMIEIENEMENMSVGSSSSRTYVPPSPRYSGPTLHENSVGEWYTPTPVSSDGEEDGHYWGDDQDDI